MRLSVILDGYYDYLTAFGLSVDTVNVSAAVEWSDEYKYVLAEDADPEHGKITFLPDKVYGCYTTIRYIPLHSGTFRIDMKLVSAAQAPYSTMQNYFFIAVK